MQASMKFHGHLAGWAYLAIIVLGAFGELVVRGTLLVPGDPAATARAIAGNAGLWRTGLVGDLLMHVLDLPVILFFYLLLKPVHLGLALLSTLLNLVQTAVLVANKLNLVLPLLLLSGSPSLQAIPAAQLQVLAMLAVQAHSFGFGIGLIFFGFACLVRAWLLLRCGCLPKALCWLLAAAGLCYLANSLTLLLAPALADALFPAVLLPPLVAELSISVWLIAKGIDQPAWDRLAARAHAA